MVPARRPSSPYKNFYTLHPKRLIKRLDSSNGHESTSNQEEKDGTP